MDLLLRDAPGTEDIHGIEDHVAVPAQVDLAFGIQVRFKEVIGKPAIILTSLIPGCADGEPLLYIHHKHFLLKPVQI